MRRPERNGYVIILSVVAIALVGAALLILAGLANSLLFDANQAHLQACNRNLVASGLAWAQHNRDKISDSSKTEQIQLDISHLNVTDGDLCITLLEPRKRTPRLQINTECRRETLKLKRSDVYLIISR
jgi:hypothetical protein